MLNPAIRTYLDSLENDRFSNETEVMEKILEISGRNISSQEDLSEFIAFSLGADETVITDSSASRRCYYTPGFRIPDFEYPASGMHPEIVEYWRSRIDETASPFLKLRYTDLVFEYTRQENPPDRFPLAGSVLSLTLDAVRVPGIDGFYGERILRRAASIAASFRDSLGVKIADLATESLLLERSSREENPGVWGFAFQTFVLELGSKGFTLPEGFEAQTAQDLHNRIVDLLTTEPVDSSSVEWPTQLLLRYYKKKNDREAVSKLLADYEQAFRSDGYQNSSAMLRTRYITLLHALHCEYASLIGRDHQRRLLVELSEVGPGIQDEMTRFETSATLSDEELRPFLELLFGSSESRKPLSQTLNEIARAHLLRIEHTEARLLETARAAPLVALATHIKYGQGGVPILSVPHTDTKGRLALQGAQQLGMEKGMLLQISLEELFARFDQEDIILELLKSPAFSPEDADYLRRSLRAYRENDFLVASALLIPFVESTIRNVVLRAGLPILKDNGSGGFEYVGLSPLIESGFFEQIYGPIGKDVVFHLDLVLVNDLGPNLRNDFAHGLNREYFGRKHTVELLIHILFVLRLLTRGESSESDPE